jgi:ATP-dependent protease ClpP protease subunit
MSSRITSAITSRTTLLGLVGSAVIGAVTSAAELSIALVDDTAVIALNGDIAAGNADAVETLIRTVNESGRLVSAVRLDSGGGSLVEAVKLADLVRRAKLPTIVAGGARCASACFIVFAAGVEKFASYDALIGVHGVSDKFGRETVQTEAATIAMARIVSRFGVPPGIIGQMVTTPAQKIAWLTPQDLREMGVVMTGQRPHPAPLPSPNHREPAALDLPSNGSIVQQPKRDDE